MRRLMNLKEVDRKLDNINYRPLFNPGMSFDYFKGLVKRVSDLFKGKRKIKLDEENSKLVEKANSQVGDYAKIVKEIYNEQYSF
jgi:hypothetical protein